MNTIEQIEESLTDVLLNLLSDMEPEEGHKPPRMIVKYVVVADYLNEDGERELIRLWSPETPGWDAAGLLHAALEQDFDDEA